MPQFKVYAAEVARAGEVAVIVTTAFTNPGGYPRAEWFLMIPDEKCTSYTERLSFDVKSFKDSPVELNEDFMLEEALSHAAIELRLHLAKTAAEKGFVLPHEGPAIMQDNKNLLVRLWIRGRCAEQLHEMGKRTDFEPLRKFLEPIYGLPRIDRHRPKKA